MKIYIFNDYGWRQYKSINEAFCELQYQFYNSPLQETKIEILKNICESRGYLLLIGAAAMKKYLKTNEV